MMSPLHYPTGSLPEHFISFRNDDLRAIAVTLDTLLSYVVLTHDDATALAYLRHVAAYCKHLAHGPLDRIAAARLPLEESPS